MCAGYAQAVEGTSVTRPWTILYVCAHTTGVFSTETVYLTVVIVANAFTFFCWRQVKARLVASKSPHSQEKEPLEQHDILEAEREHTSHERFHYIHFGIIFGVAMSPFW